MGTNKPGVMEMATLIYKQRCWASLLRFQLEMEPRYWALGSKSFIWSIDNMNLKYEIERHDYLEIIHNVLVEFVK